MSSRCGVADISIYRAVSVNPSAAPAIDPRSLCLENLATSGIFPLLFPFSFPPRIVTVSLKRTDPPTPDTPLPTTPSGRASARPTDILLPSLPWGAQARVAAPPPSWISYGMCRWSLRSVLIDPFQCNVTENMRPSVGSKKPSKVTQSLREDFTLGKR